VIFIEQLAVAMFPSLSVAVSTKLKVPVAVGTPERTPAGESSSPVGNVPDVFAQVTAPIPPVEVKMCA
jgi:hypothetical protein